jgi:hypothetical protein
VRAWDKARRIGVADFAVRARHGGNAQCLHRLLGGDLVAHHADMFRLGANERQAMFLDDVGELGVFRQKTIAGMDGFGAGDLAGGDNSGDVEIGLGRGGRADADAFIGQLDVHCLIVGGGMDRHRGDAHLLAGADDAKRDFAAIGDEDFIEHQAMTQRVWPYSTGVPSVTWISFTVPPLGAAMAFMVFIASTMNSVSPSLTVLPTLMKGGLPGSGEA